VILMEGRSTGTNEFDGGRTMWLRVLSLQGGLNIYVYLNYVLVISIHSGHLNCTMVWIQFVAYALMHGDTVPR
jgi:hypothetical protein